MRILYGLSIAIAIGLSSLPFSTWAVPQNIYDSPKIVAVEPRTYNPKYDLTAQLSVLPLDAFYKGFAMGVNYTHSMSSAWSWEVVNFNVNSKSDTGLRQDLIDNFAAAPKGYLDHIAWYATTSAVYTPIYSKNLLFNDQILYGSFSFVASGGFVTFASGDTAPLFGGGVILRVFHSPKYSSKFDGRLYAHTSSGKSSDLVMMITYGLSFEFGDHLPWQ